MGFLRVIITLSDKMQIFVKLADSATVTLQVEPENTVEEIKARLRAKKTVMAGKESKLTFGGRQLADGYTLSEYNVQRESTLQSMDSLRGGFPDPYYFTMIMLGAFMLLFVNAYAQFGSSTAIKCAIIVSMTFSEACILCLALNTQTTREGATLKTLTMWYIVLMGNWGFSFVS